MVWENGRRGGMLSWTWLIWARSARRRWALPCCTHSTAGDMRRGSTHHLTAGILFCDIRGFTAHSAKTSPEQVVEVVNDLFTIVEAEAQGRRPTQLQCPAGMS